jgi:hypothetical protein
MFWLVCPCLFALRQKLANGMWVHLMPQGIRGHPCVEQLLDLSEASCVQRAESDRQNPSQILWNGQLAGGTINCMTNSGEAEGQGCNQGQGH